MSSSKEIMTSTLENCYISETNQKNNPQLNLSDTTTKKHYDHATKIADEYYNSLEQSIAIEKRRVANRIMMLMAKKRYEQILPQIQNICCSKKILENQLCLQWMGNIMQHSDLFREYLDAKAELEYVIFEHDSIKKESKKLWMMV